MLEGRMRGFRLKFLCFEGTEEVRIVRLAAHGEGNGLRVGKRVRSASAAGQRFEAKGYTSVTRIA